MFDLEKREKSILLFLVSALLIGLSVLAYKKSHTSADVRIGSFDVEGERKLNAEASEKVKININQAGIEDLMKLPGIGKVAAGRILEYRSSNGSFHSAEEIKKVKGIGKSVFEKIKENITTE